VTPRTTPECRDTTTEENTTMSQHDIPQQRRPQPYGPGEQPPVQQTRTEARANAKAAKAHAKALRPWWKRKRVLIPAGLVALGALGSAAGGGTSSNGTVASDPAEAFTPAFPGHQPDDVVGATGDTLQIGDLQVQAAPFTAVHQMYSGDKLCSEVTYTNTGDGTEHFNPLDWTLQDPDGAALMTSYADGSDYLRSGQLSPGGTVSGEVCFDRQGPGQYVLLLDPMLGDRAAWTDTPA